MSDAINPDHYKRLPAEAIEIIEAAIANAPSNEDAFLHGQVLKYILRCWNKNGIEDLRKAKWYLDRLIEHCDESLLDISKGLVKAWTCEDGKAKQVYPDPKWTPKLGDWVRIKKPGSDKRDSVLWSSFMDEHDKEVVQVKEIKDGAMVHGEWFFPFEWLEPAEQPKPTLNSDKIPDGYRKLKNSSIEPRQRGDLRWSVAEKRYIEIGFDEIGYANRDNWAACRRITGEAAGEGTWEVKPPDGWRPNDNVSLAMQMAANSFGGNDGVFNGAGFANAMRQLAGVTCNLDGYVVATILDGRTDVEVLKGGSHYKYLFWSPGNTQSIEQPAEAPEATGEVTGEAKPPDGWRWLERGELIRKGDKPVKGDAIPLLWIGTPCANNHFILRRNRFEIGEKVIDCRSGVVFAVQHFNKTHKIVFVDGVPDGIESKHFAPYIEESK